MVLAHLGGGAVEVGDGHTVAAQLDDLVLAQLDRLAGERDEGGDVGGEEVLALAAPDHQRRVAARADDHVRGVGVHGDEGERAVEAAADHPHGLGEVTVVGLAQQVGDDLGVGLRAQRVTALGELRPQLGEVLDDAVVDDRDLRGVVQVGVGVGVRRSAVGGPPGVADSGGTAGERGLGERLLEVGELSGPLVGGEAPLPVGAKGLDGHTGGVVPPVLQPLQACDYYVKSGLSAHISNNSAHACQHKGRFSRHSAACAHSA